MGLRQLRERLAADHMQSSYIGLFPKNTAKNTRFAINFWTAIVRRRKPFLVPLLI